MDGWLGATLLVVGFLGLCRLFGMIANARQVLALSNAAFAVMGDPTLDDDSREQAMQRHAITLFGVFLRLVAGGAAAVLLPLGLVWLADRAGLLSWDASLEVGLSLEFILLVTIVSIAGWLLWRHFQPDPIDPAQPVSDYSAMDRLLHRTAFASVPVQVALSGMEERLFRRRLVEIDPVRPVFVTGLPRAGTTLLLELCYRTGEFATHTYRQMPFVLNPLIWETCSRRFRRTSATAQERAHGDGMLITADSPEALEEIVWMAFWRTHYGPTTIAPWAADDQARGFPSYFRRHMAKMIALSSGSGMTGPGAAQRRYLSKNNLNIARIGWLRGTFPDARVVVPFREPLAHATSLLRQHGNFLARHRADPFAREYMAAIGHFDFGANLRPVNFDGWMETGAMLNPETLDFWLAYWTATYRALQRESAHSQVRLLDFDVLCAEPEAGLQELAIFLELGAPDKLVAQSPRFRIPPAHPVEGSTIDNAILREAMILHEALRRQASPGRQVP